MVVSIVAEAYGLPMLPSYLNLSKGQDVRQGVKFAFVGATALDMDYFIQKILIPPSTNISLSVQLDWFKKLKPSLCKNKQGFSFGKIDTFKACCGKSEPYNVDVHIFCGSLASTVCFDPSKHINWDGAHLTEATYRLIAKGIVEGPFASPSLKSPAFKIA
uniref:GDSL esterase/lipase At3g48460 n=1 Tax=Cajanus cajan TaxID=3821 RepID=A0A151UBE8_CAJCA|nr:GDSL esterase/lipase At3g48460 [Cajanus cajan]